MKDFHLKRLIPSLAVPLMIVAAAFAPLPCFLGTAHAAPDAPDSLQIVNPAKLDLATSGGSTNGVDITFNYNCATGTGGTIDVTSAAQSAAQSGTGVGDTASSSTSGGPISAICDGATHQASATLYGTGTFNVGLMTVSATLTNGTTITNATATIRVIL